MKRLSVRLAVLTNPFPRKMEKFERHFRANEEEDERDRVAKVKERLDLEEGGR